MFDVEQISKVRDALRAWVLGDPITAQDANLARDMLSQLIDLLSNPCLASRIDGEPFFVLLARDPDAPSTLRRWGRYRYARLERTQPEKLAADEDKIKDAARLAEKFLEWRIANAFKWRKPWLLMKIRSRMPRASLPPPKPRPNDSPSFHN